MKRFAVTAALLAAALASPSAFGAEVPRTILKTFFETGDVPTQDDFADLIDSLVHYTDDRDFIGLRTYDPNKTYELGDTVIFQNSITSSTGHVSTNVADYLNFSTQLAPGVELNDLHFDMASYFAGQTGYLEFAVADEFGQPYFGYMQISRESFGPGETNPYFFVEYLVYEDSPSTSMALVELPEPASLTLMSSAALFLLARRRR